MKPALKAADISSVADMPVSIEYDEISSSDGCMAGGEDTQSAGRSSMLAQRETEQIRIFRILILVLIVVSGIILSVLSYTFMNKEKEDTVHAKYEDAVGTISQVMKDRENTLRLAMRGLGETVTASAIASVTEFPFVTVPLFEVYGRNTRLLSNVESVVYAPLVETDEVELWNSFSTENQGWIEESQQLGQIENVANSSITPFIYAVQGNASDRNLVKIPSEGPAPFNPFWQCSPLPTLLDAFNFDIFSGNNQWARDLFGAVQQAHEALFSPVQAAEPVSNTAPYEHYVAFHEGHVSKDVDASNIIALPRSIIMQPVFVSFNMSTSVAGLVYGTFAWDTYMSKLLPPESAGSYHVVLSNNCNQTYTYLVDADEATFLGPSDFHDVQWDALGRTISLDGYLFAVTNAIAGHCIYSVDIYPTDRFWSESLESRLPVVFCWVTAAAYAVMAGVFILYDIFVTRRNRKIVNNAVKSNDLIASLFPSNVRDRLLADREQQETSEKVITRRPSLHLQSLGGFLLDQGSVASAADDFEEEDEDDDLHRYSTPPIADLFPETTILFADIAGFTAWSSAREPREVFILLETLYRAFDIVAKRRKIWKVETIGDCYVAVSGVPDPRHDHAVAMTRFARDCLYKTRSLTKRLEKSLGPGTAALAMRMGLHSGPVTAGVLRGERSRFQLFGDTVNTASRIETTGERDRIQISQETAELLIEAGKARWLVPREEKVYAKGKGEINTYWFRQSLPKGEQREIDSTTDDDSGDDISYVSESSAGHDIAGGENDTDGGISKKTSRLIDWNVDLLLRFLVQIVARRQSASEEIVSSDSTRAAAGNDILDEVVECLAFPAYRCDQVETSAVIDPAVESQLRDYVTKIAALYKDNPFHNFEHASHVCMSVVKLLSRIVTPPPTSSVNSTLTDISGPSMAETLHHQTFGLSSDPMTHFASVFSALIHAVGHLGIPNSVLAEQESKLTQQYGKVSITQQRSFAIAWDMLMRHDFEALLNALCPTDGERKRFRQLLINLLIASDVEDIDQMELRQSRWSEAFPDEFELTAETADHIVALRGTVTVEYLMQASVMAHAMQHWHVFYKWSFALLRERSLSLGKDQVISDWYALQLESFDKLILPVAKKLGSGIFGATGKQYLNYAVTNRQEWEARGVALAAEVGEMAY